jgi:hypothetical protein
MKTYTIYNHQGKGDVFESALRQHGYTRSEIGRAQVILMDVDAPGRMVRINQQVKSNRSKVFCYPHSARPFVGWDGLFPSSPLTTASFIFAEGHRDVIRAYGYKKPLHTVGWAYTEIKPFHPVSEMRRVLFAPIHPNRNGFLSGLDKAINARTYQILLDMVDADQIELTVRHIQPLNIGGLWPDKRVAYVRGETDTKQMADADNADVVVSHQTYAWDCVAIGKPTVMMAEYEAPRNGGDEPTFKRVNSWEAYKELLMFPLDILDTSSPYELLVRACKTDADIADWKRRMIGAEVFSPTKFVHALETYL